MEKNKTHSLKKEAWLVWIGLITLLSLTYQSWLLKWVSMDLLFLITAGLLLYVPLWIHHRAKEKISYLDFSLKDFWKSIQWFGVVSIAIFPIVFLVNHFYQQFLGRPFHGNAQNFSIFSLALSRLLLALPEEFFFRGYLQQRFNGIYGRPWTFFGAPFGKSLLLVSFLFALSHSLIQTQWWHFLIFFPSLVFGWLQEKRGTITTAVLFHTACNVFADWVALHY